MNTLKIGKKGRQKTNNIEKRITKKFDEEDGHLIEESNSEVLMLSLDRLLKRLLTFKPIHVIHYPKKNCFIVSHLQNKQFALKIQFRRNALKFPLF